MQRNSPGHHVGPVTLAKTPAQFDQLIRDEIDKWTKPVKAAGIHVV